MTELRAPKDLYLLWERQQWRSQAIDFTRDRRDWEGLEPRLRDELAWNLSQFFVGEERVTKAFAPIVMAAEDPDEEAFLASQQVDEARHTQFFDRFWREVVGDDAGAPLGERLALVREACNDAFVELFDKRLMAAVDRLRLDPGDLEAKVEAVTIYHMVIEGALALTGQHFTVEYLTRTGLLPGFRAGFERVARDEHRHLAYGTWFLKEKCREERLAASVRETLGELLPITALVLVPPAYAGESEYEVLGYSSHEITEFALTALMRRLRVIGIDLPTAAAVSG
jgi:ribonucleoside-diphosphate reductase beta chain